MDQVLSFYNKKLRLLCGLGVLDVVMMYGAYSTTRHLALSRIFIRFIWFTVASVSMTFLYVWVLLLFCQSCVNMLFFWLFIIVIWKLPFWLGINHLHLLSHDRQALKEESKPNSNPVVFRIYIFVIGIYAGVQLFLGVLMRIPACHRMTNKCDRSPVIRFFKWMRQVSFWYCFQKLHTFGCLCCYNLICSCRNARLHIWVERHIHSQPLDFFLNIFWHLLICLKK